MMYLSRRYRFACSHRLYTPRLSEAENRETYGKCSNPFGHGHDYVLEVRVRGPLDERTGRVVPVRALDHLVETQVMQAFDHRDLNAQAAEFAAVVPTTENLALVIRRRLLDNWAAAFPGPGPQLDRIRIHETKRNMFEISEGV